MLILATFVSEERADGIFPESITCKFCAQVMLVQATKTNPFKMDLRNNFIAFFATGIVSL